MAALHIEMARLITKLMLSFVLPWEISRVSWSRITSMAPLGKIPETESRRLAIVLGSANRP
jgi:hypothetical protein